MTRLFLSVLFVVGSLAAPVLAASHAGSAKDAVMSHLRGVGALDVDAMVAPYADDAVLITPEKTYAGSDEIRAFYEAYVAEFSQPDIAMDTDALIFEGNTALIVWRAETAGKVYEFGTDSYFVQDGEIVSHTSAAKITGK